MPVPVQAAPQGASEQRPASRAGRAALTQDDGVYITDRTPHDGSKTVPQTHTSTSHEESERAQSMVYVAFR
jgi:hypothetical protein